MGSVSDITAANGLRLLAAVLATTSHIGEHIEAIRSLPGRNVEQATLLALNEEVPYTVAAHLEDKFFPPDLEKLRRLQVLGATVCLLQGGHTRLFREPLKVFSDIKAAEDRAVYTIAAATLDTTRLSNGDGMISSADGVSTRPASASAAAIL